MRSIITIYPHLSKINKVKKKTWFALPTRLLLLSLILAEVVTVRGCHICCGKPNANSSFQSSHNPHLTYGNYPWFHLQKCYTVKLWKMGHWDMFFLSLSLYGVYRAKVHPTWRVIRCAKPSQSAPLRSSRRSVVGSGRRRNTQPAGLGGQHRRWTMMHPLRKMRWMKLDK